MFYAPWWYHGIGAGGMVRYEIPIVKNGFIPAINDQFSLEPALGFAWQRGYGDYCDVPGADCRKYYGERGTITPVVYGVWSFHITSKFRPYAALGLGADIGIDSDDDWHFHPSNFFFDSAVGLFYRFATPVALRAEIGSGGPKVGLSFYF